MKQKKNIYQYKKKKLIFSLVFTSVAWHVDILFGTQFRVRKTFDAVSVAPSVTIIIILLQPVLSKNMGSSSA
jgi:hypothetical protein